MHFFKKTVFICLALSCFANSNTLKANLFFNEKVVRAISDKTSLSPELIDVILASTAVMAFVGVLALCIKVEKNAQQKRLLEEQEREQKLTDDNIIQEEQQSLEVYKSRFENDCINAEGNNIETFMLYIKQKNHFPYFIPYRSKVAQAAVECTKSLNRIKKRIKTNLSYEPKSNHNNFNGLITLKKDYKRFIQKLSKLKEVAYQCIKASTIEYLLFNWILTTARIRENETPSFVFSYLVNDLI